MAACNDVEFGKRSRAINIRNQDALLTLWSSAAKYEGGERRVIVEFPAMVRAIGASAGAVLARTPNRADAPRNDC